MNRIPLIERLGRRAIHLGERAVQELLADEDRARALGRAARHMQAGRRAIDESSSKLIAALGLATKPDLDRVTRKMGRLRKRLEGLLDTLDGDEA